MATVRTDNAMVSLVNVYNPLEEIPGLWMPNWTCRVKNNISLSLQPG